MDAMLLGKLFGNDQHWHGPCTIIVDADAGVQSVGVDAIGSSAVKTYAPRVVSGRIVADSVCLLHDGKALLALQQLKIRQSGSEDSVKQTLTLIDPAHVVGVEFLDCAQLAALGLTTPPIRAASNPGTSLRPTPSTKLTGVP
jgi:hypothetical protein